jgi:phage baseplate assembly protein W
MTDLKITDNGDLIIGANGDLAVVSGDEQLAQQIVFLLKTTAGDNLLEPEIGVSLEDFIGEENSTATRLRIENRVRSALLFDLSLSSVEVTCIPLDKDEVFILIELPSKDDPDKVIQVSSQLDLQKGLVFDRVNYTI